MPALREVMTDLLQTIESTYYRLGTASHFQRNATGK